MPSNLTTIYSDPHAIREHLEQADLVIGAVLIPGAKAPNLITREDLKIMKQGSVIVDVSIDQGGCVEDGEGDNALEADVRSGRRGALLRGQHARRWWPAPARKP